MWVIIMQCSESRWLLLQRATTMLQLQKRGAVSLEQAAHNTVLDPFCKTRRLAVQNTSQDPLQGRRSEHFNGQGEAGGLAIREAGLPRERHRRGEAHVGQQLVHAGGAAHGQVHNTVCLLRRQIG